MADESVELSTRDAASRLPFPLKRQSSKPWLEQALTRVAEQRFALDWIRRQPGVEITEEMIRTLQDHWAAVAEVASHRRQRGASVERVESHLDAVDGDLLRTGPASYVYGQLPGLLTRVQRVCPKDDLARVRIEALHDRSADATLTPGERNLIVAVHNLVTRELRQEVTRLRSFARMLRWTAVSLAIGASGLAAFGGVWPDKIPVCFNPGTNIVCPTTTSRVPGLSAAPPSGQPAGVPQDQADRAMRAEASGWDVALVELVGLVAAAVAAATSLRGLRGSSKPFDMPIALALLKLPSGMLTALLGLLLMRGEFIPGLSALDSSAQIISWAIILGYSQQLLTRVVDQRAQTVLDNFSRSVEQKQQAEAVVGTGAPPV
jgi:hypothetical protein